MGTLEKRMELLITLGAYLDSGKEDWLKARAQISQNNSWFIPEFVEGRICQIRYELLDEKKLRAWMEHYRNGFRHDHRVVIGVILAGRYPGEGVQDFICTFLSGHTVKLRLAPQDRILIPFFINKLKEWEPELGSRIFQTEMMLRDCDGYIVPGRSSFDGALKKYFGKYPGLIRDFTTSVAILDGTETASELALLAGDVCSFYGRSPRNVNKIYIPEGYDFSSLMEQTEIYGFLKSDHHYRDNFDYRLSLLLLNKEPYLTNEILLLRKSPDLFSPISVLNYETYENTERLASKLKLNRHVERLVGHGFDSFGSSAKGSLSDYPNQKDTMAFLQSL